MKKSQIILQNHYEKFTSNKTSPITSDNILTAEHMKELAKKHLICVDDKEWWLPEDNNDKA